MNYSIKKGERKGEIECESVSIVHIPNIWGYLKLLSNDDLQKNGFVLKRFESDKTNFYFQL